MSGGSTAIDFAYAVHTDIGHHCRACRINRRLAPLSVPLESGQTVEILTEKVPQTSPAWLNFAVTPRARNSIRHYLSNLKTSEARKFGKRLLDQSLGNMNIKLRDIDKNELRKVLNNIGVRSLNRLLEEIGLGLRVGNIVAQQITGFLKENHSVKQKELVPLEITGSEGLIVNYAVCCKPIPGDSVIGHFTAERGLVIHQERCKNILSVREDPQQCFPVNWGEPSGRSFTAQIKVVARDEPGLLANLASVITSQEANIASIQTMEINTGMHEFILDLEVTDRLHLSRILRKIKTLNNIVSVTRIHDWEMRQATAMH